MLRIIVISLLAGNLGLAAYHVLTARESQQTAVEESRALPAAPARQVPQLTLLNEMPPVEESAGLQCFSLGPFETVQSLEVAREAVMIEASSIVDRESEALVELGYWVTLPAFPNFAEAAQTMQALNKAGLMDTAVIADAEGAYFVSLGYFLDESNARRRRDHARSLGHSAETRLQRETQSRYWLDLEVDVSIAGGSDLASGQVPPGISASQFRAIPCPDNQASQSPSSDLEAANRNSAAST